MACVVKPSCPSFSCQATVVSLSEADRQEGQEGRTGRKDRKEEQGIYSIDHIRPIIPVPSLIAKGRKEGKTGREDRKEGQEGRDKGGVKQRNKGWKENKGRKETVSKVLYTSQIT